jgi:capsular polysaccharide biosynthesis protein
MESVLSSINWAVRRAVTLALGEGPKRIASLAPRGEECALLLEEPGESFTAPASPQVSPDLPSPVSAWPQTKVTAPVRRIWSVQQAGLFDDDGVIYDLRTRAAFVETLTYWHRPPGRHPALALRRGRPARVLEGTSIFLGGLGGQTFYHFLVENLPKISWLRPWLAQADRIVVQNYLEPTKAAWLRHVGMPLPVEWLNPLDHFHCERLIFCTPLVADCLPGVETIARLRQLTRPSAEIKRRHRFVWATRRNNAVRNVSWEEDLQRRLPAGWEIIDFAQLTPAETIALGEECAGFAGLHGAAFANLALWREGIRVLEVYTQSHAPWYPCLSLSAGHQHEIIFANSPNGIPEIVQRLAGFTAATNLP